MWLSGAFVGICHFGKWTVYSSIIMLVNVWEIFMWTSFCTFIMFYITPSWISWLLWEWLDLLLKIRLWTFNIVCFQLVYAESIVIFRYFTSVIIIMINYWYNVRVAYNYYFTFCFLECNNFIAVLCLCIILFGMGWVLFYGNFVALLFWNIQFVSYIAFNQA